MLRRLGLPFVVAAGLMAEGCSRPCTGPECSTNICVVTASDGGCYWRQPDCCLLGPTPNCGAPDYVLEATDAGACLLAAPIAGG
jgi:hypothetical protein